MDYRWWGMVAKDGSHIRAAMPAPSKEIAEQLLTEGWTPELKELYEVKPVVVSVDTTPTQ